MSSSRSRALSLAVALIVAAGLMAAGWFSAQGLVRFRMADRYVTVKGLAERYVEADLVIWPLPHAVVGNDLVAVQTALESNTESVRRFFLDAGFGAEEIMISPPRLEDRAAYAWGEQQPVERFRYGNTVTLRTQRVAEALTALRQTGQLVASGVLLTDGGFPQFEYTCLNDIKPELIAEATANARAAAEQFALDSGAEVGGIRSANQGVIDISDRDQGSPQVKKIRVVTTVDYFLLD
jgi:hypothetical protein